MLARIPQARECTTSSMARIIFVNKYNCSTRIVEIEKNNNFKLMFFFKNQHLLNVIFFSPLTTVLSQWDFSHGKFGLFSMGKASCDRVALTHQWCTLGVSVFP